MISILLERDHAKPPRGQDAKRERVDLFVEGKVIIEMKSVEKITDTHKKQLLTYMKLTNTNLGYILNFGSAFMKDGIIRIVNGLSD